MFLWDVAGLGGFESVLEKWYACLIDFVRNRSHRHGSGTYEDGLCAGNLHLVSKLISVIGGVCRRHNSIEVVHSICECHGINL